MFAKRRYAPGTPAGNCLKNDIPVYVNTPLPYLHETKIPSPGFSLGSFVENVLNSSKTINYAFLNNLKLEFGLSYL